MKSLTQVVGWTVLCVGIGFGLTAVNLPTDADAQTMTVGPADAYAYESITVAATPIGFTSTLVSPTNQRPANAVFCTQETADLRYNYNGATPSTTEGHLSASGSSFRIVGVNNVNRFRAIRTTGTSSVLKCTLER